MQLNRLSKNNIYSSLVNYTFDTSNISRYRSELMGIAIIMIMLCHNSIIFSNDKIQLVHTIAITQLMQVGVDIFFFLSAIGCCYSLKNDSNTLHFYEKRLYRILPTYITVVFLYCIVRSVVGAQLSISDIFERFSLVTFFTRDVLEEWFVSGIIVLYFIFPIIFKVRSSFLLIQSCLWVFFFSLVISICKIQIPMGNGIFIIRIPIFLFGILLFDYIEKGIRISIRGGMLGVIVWLVLFCTLLLVNRFNTVNPWWLCRALFFPIAVLLIILMVFVLEITNISWLHRFLSLLGSVTLEIYLIHEKILDIQNILFESFIKTNAITMIINHALSMVISIILAFFIRWLIVHIFRRTGKGRRNAF